MRVLFAPMRETRRKYKYQDSHDRHHVIAYRKQWQLRKSRRINRLTHEVNTPKVRASLLLKSKDPALTRKIMLAEISVENSATRILPHLLTLLI